MLFGTNGGCLEAGRDSLRRFVSDEKSFPSAFQETDIDKKGCPMLGQPFCFYENVFLEEQIALVCHVCLLIQVGDDLVGDETC